MQTLFLWIEHEIWSDSISSLPTKCPKLWHDKHHNSYLYYKSILWAISSEFCYFILNLRCKFYSTLLHDWKEITRAIVQMRFQFNKIYNYVLQYKTLYHLWEVINILIHESSHNKLDFFSAFNKIFKDMQKNIFSYKIIEKNISPSKHTK